VAQAPALRVKGEETLTVPDTSPAQRGKGLRTKIINP